jgi:hypothetical protein
MAASFFTHAGQTHIISNTMSVFQAGFHLAKSYYNKNGDTLHYYTHDSGAVLARISRRRHQTVNKFFSTTAEANGHFKSMNKGLTFQTGKWVPERKETTT